MRLSLRAAPVAGAVALALALSACGDNGGEAGTSANAVTIRGCNPENPLIPANTNEVCGGNVLDQLFTRLVSYSPETGEPVNEIAESITSEDNQIWTITLKDGWTFHDGTPITAQSFVDAWNWAAQGANGALNAYFFEPIQGYSEVQGTFTDDGAYEEGSATAETMSGLAVVDERSFTVSLTQPESSFPLRLGYVAFAPLPEVFYDDVEAFGLAPVGSGPFEFESWDANVEIRVAPYDAYQGDRRPKIDEAVFKIYENDEAAYNDLQADQLDIMAELPTAAVAGNAYQNDLGERFIEREIGQFQSLTFASAATDERLASPTMRKAISMAIDRQQIVDQIFSSTRAPATGWVSPVVDGFVAGACGDFCVYNPEQAKALLDDAGGWPEGERLTIAYNADADHAGWVAATCNSIKNALGIPCDPQPEVDLATFRQKVNDRALKGLMRTGWQMDYPSAENFLAPIYATGAGTNDGDYTNPAFDAALEEAAGLQGDAAIAKYNEAERMLANDMPAIPMWHYKIIAGYSTHVANVRITVFGNVDLLDVTTN